MDYETFINASFFLQGKANQFAQQKPADRKNILSTILGLEVWEEYRNRANERRKTEEQVLNEIDTRLDEIERELAEEDRRKQELSRLQAQADQIKKLREAKAETLKQVQRRYDIIQNQKRLVETLRKNTEESRSRKDNHSRNLAQRLVDKQTYLDQLRHAEEIEQRYREWQKLSLELEKCEKLASQYHQIERELQPHKMKIETERAKLEQEKRYLIEQKNKVEQESKQRAQLEEKKRTAAMQMQELEADITQREQLLYEIQQLQRKKADLTAENKQLHSEMDVLKKRIRQLADAEAPVCPVCGQDLAEPDRISLIESLDRDGKEKSTAYRTNQERIGQLDIEISAKQKSVDSLFLKEAMYRSRQKDFDQYEHRLEEIAKMEQEWASGSADRLTLVQKLLAEETFAPEARLALAEIEARLINLGYDPALHESLRSQEQTLRSSQEALNRLRQAQAALQPLEKTIQDMQDQLRLLEEQLMKNEEDLRREEQLLQAEMKDLPDLRTVEQDYLRIQEQENNLQRELGGAKQKVDILEVQRRRKAEFLEQRKFKADLISRLKVLEKAFSKDGVPALLIEQALPEIEMQANEILDRLTAGNMSVQFITQKAFKDKKREDMKETLDIQISDSNGSREYEMYSGGEAFRVNFAIRLALSRVLAQRAGARLQTLVIDEGFGSQDTEGRQRLIEAINQVHPFFAKILVITHLDDLKDAFPARIEVEKSALGSTVRIWS